MHQLKYHIWEISVHWNSDKYNKVNDALSKNFFTSSNTWVANLTEEIMPVISENDEFDYRDKPILLEHLVFLDYQAFLAHIKTKSFPFLTSSIVQTPQMRFF